MDSLQFEDKYSVQSHYFHRTCRTLSKCSLTCDICFVFLVSPLRLTVNVKTL